MGGCPSPAEDRIPWSLHTHVPPIDRGLRLPEMLPTERASASLADPVPGLLAMEDTRGAEDRSGFYPRGDWGS